MSGSGEEDDSELVFPEANVMGVDAVARILATTLGPTGRDKLLLPEDDSDPVPGVDDTEVVITGDGATILEGLPIAHPLAPVLRRVVGPERPGETDVEGERIPDGITTRIVLAAALLDVGTDLLDRGLHPRAVTAGYERALTRARDALTTHSRPIDAFDDPAGARRAVARTAMTGNDVGGLAGRTVPMVLDAVDEVGIPDEVAFHVCETRGDSVDDTRLIRGTVIDRSEPAHRRMPTSIDDASILAVGGHDRGGLIERDAPENATAQLDTPDEAAAYEAMRRDRKRTIVEDLSALGVDMVVTRLGIDEDYQRLLADRDMLGIRAVSRLQIARLGAATGANPVLDITDVESGDLGSAGTVDYLEAEGYPRKGGQRTLFVVDGCSNPSSVTFLLRGLFDQPAGQATTQLRKAALSVALADCKGPDPGGVLPGGGGAHLIAARAVRKAARSVSGREQLAMTAYADALDRVIATLATNAGLDGRGAVADLKAAKTGDGTCGLTLPTGEVVDPFDRGILDATPIVRDAYLHGTDLATLVLGVDDTIDAVDDDVHDDE